MIIDTITAAAGSLDYAADALEAPHGSHMRAVTRDLKEARKVVAELLEAMEALVISHRALCNSPEWDAQDEAEQERARAAIRRAKGDV